jgi:hypothetical protein
MVLDATPKIITPSRGDCAICFAGDTAATFPLMLHISEAIAAHGPAQSRNLDLNELKGHLLKVCTDIMLSVVDRSASLEPSDVQFIFGGYSWRAKDFCIWTFYYEKASRRFRARPSNGFHDRLGKAAFIGDWASRYRGELVRFLNDDPGVRVLNREPLKVLSEMVKAAGPHESIGGVPQVVRVGPHMNTRPFCVKWGSDERPYLFGRQLADYENCDYWTIDPASGRISPPRHFRLDKGEPFEES